MKFPRWFNEVIRSTLLMGRTGCLNIRPRRALFAIWIFASAGSPIHAQVVPDGGTRTLANATNTITGTVTVGTNGSFTRLTLGDNALLTSLADGVIGRNATARSNEVRLVSPSARWNVQTDLTLGLQGSRNRLAVSNGAAMVSGGNTYFGAVPGANNNVAVVTGAGSVWSNRADLYMEDGVGNRLEVTAGGRLVTGSATIGFGPTANDNMVVVADAGSSLNLETDFTLGLAGSRNRLVVSNGAAMVSGRNTYFGAAPGANSNVAVVTGAGSVWSNRADLYMEDSVGNRLEVTGGGRLVTSNASIGFGPTANGNTVVLTDAGSSWNNLASLSVGQSGSDNVLLVSNGATVASSNVTVGLKSSSINNRVTVNGGTLRAASADGTGVLDVRRGTNVINAGLVDVDRLVLTNRARSFLSAGNVSSNYITDAGPATPYPSTLSVAGIAGNITKMIVSLEDLTCVNPDAYDILLVSPAGQKVMLMSDAGGFSPGIANVSLTFDDAASLRLPDSTNFSSGTYRPSDYGSIDFMPLPAPAGPYSTNLSSFNGISPNGVWSLYIAGRFGSPSSEGNSLLAWRIQIETSGGVFELNGGTLVTRGAVISNALPFVVGGPGGVPAVWEARAGLSDNVVTRDILVGNNSSFNQLVIPSGVVAAGDDVIVGAFPAASTNNLLRVTGGTLRVLTPGTALNVRGGTNRIDAGLVDVNRLIVTNTRGQFEMFGGTLRTPSTTIANGRVCIIGGGASLATLQLLGGTHTFANNLTIATNGSLIGTATIDGTVTVSPGGRLTPGSPIGRMDVLGSVILQGAVNLQIDKSGGVRTSDQVSASGALFYGGTLNVTDIGTDVLSAGDRFFLFTATPYIGAFTTLNLPPLASGLSWRNNLSVDGSIEVTTAVVSTPGFSAIKRTGTNVVFTGTNGTPNANFGLLTATNVELPLSNWVVVLTNRFDALGRFQITNPVTPADRQRYFRLLTP